MNIVFVENRYKTLLYEPIGSELEKQGHTVFWIVQNKDFTPKNKKNTFVIPYPKQVFTPKKKEASVEEIIKIDRQQNHFHKKDKSYFYYYDEKITEILHQIKPDIVFGEATAFHELLAIKYCREHKLLYLNPSSCRYPSGRFSFYQYDTLQPYKGSAEVLSNEKAQEIIDAIVYRKAIPDYMKAVPITKYAILKDKFLKVQSYLKGERFNTPSPIVKYQKEQEKTALIKKWDAKAVATINKEVKKTSVLFPLHMQPEASIDVYGKQYLKQSELIQKIAETLKDDCVLYVKPNPKSNHELSKELLSLVSTNNTIIPLHHSTTMNEVLPLTDVVITVTGTIAIECVLSNKPVITLIDYLDKDTTNYFLAKEITEINKAIHLVKTNSFPTINNTQKINFINWLNSTSFKGIISDPFSDANCIHKNNIDDLVIAFNKILANVS